jgi:DNA-binding response OmpR family regulator
MLLQPRPNQVRQHPLRIQLIDGDAVARRRVSEYLRAAGLDVHEAGDALGALVQMRQAAPDVLLVDPALPWSRALMLDRARDARLRAVPLVLFSSQVNLTRRIEELDARAGVAKPIDMDVLLAVLTRVAARASAAHPLRIEQVSASACSGYPPVARKSRSADASPLPRTGASVR